MLLSSDDFGWDGKQILEFWPHEETSTKDRKTDKQKKVVYYFSKKRTEIVLI